MGDAVEQDLGIALLQDDGQPLGSIIRVCLDILLLVLMANIVRSWKFLLFSQMLGLLGCLNLAPQFSTSHSPVQI